MKNFIFEEVDGTRTLFSNFPKPTQDTLKRSACQRCQFDLESHENYYLINYIICESGQLLFWCNVEKEQKKTLY